MEGKVGDKINNKINNKISNKISDNINNNINIKILSYDDIESLHYILSCENKNIEKLNINLFLDRNSDLLEDIITKIILFFYDSKRYIRILIRKKEKYTYILFKNNEIFLPEDSFKYLLQLLKKLKNKNISFLLSGYGNSNLFDLDILRKKYSNPINTVLTISRSYYTYYMFPSLIEYFKNSNIKFQDFSKKYIDNFLHLFYNGYFYYPAMNKCNLKILIILSLNARGFINDIYDVYKNSDKIIKIDKELHELITKDKYSYETKVIFSKIPDRLLREYSISSQSMKLPLNEILKMNFPTIFIEELENYDRDFFDNFINFKQ